MLIDKWELLKAYVDGLYASSTGTTQKMLGKVSVRMDVLDKNEQVERDGLMSLPTIQGKGELWEKEE